MRSSRPDGFTCMLKVHNHVGVVGITGNTTTGTDASSQGFFASTGVTQVNGRVGIRTDSPTTLLDVAGNVAAGNITATACTGTHLSLTGNAAVGNITAASIAGTRPPPPWCASACLLVGVRLVFGEREREAYITNVGHAIMF